MVKAVWQPGSHSSCKNQGHVDPFHAQSKKVQRKACGFWDTHIQGIASTLSSLPTPSVPWWAPFHLSIRHVHRSFTFYSHSRSIVPRSQLIARNHSCVLSSHHMTTTSASTSSGGKIPSILDSLLLLSSLPQALHVKRSYNAHATHCQCKVDTAADTHCDNRHDAPSTPVEPGLRSYITAWHRVPGVGLHGDRQGSVEDQRRLKLASPREHQLQATERSHPT